jgi:hypothetical protein
LIVKLENFGIVLHFVYARKFDTMTLELDGDAHLPAGVTTADVRPATTYAAGRIRCTNSINQRSAVGWDADSVAPSLQGFRTQHW